MISASQAFHRFGLGPRPGDLAQEIADPRRLLYAELDNHGTEGLDSPDLLDCATILRERFRQTQLSRSTFSAILRRLYFVPIDKRVFEAEVNARIERALSTRTGFVERLTAFWMDHFVVETDANGTVRRTAGAFEREAIRPFVLGRFQDMLLAVTRHPAMLSYLDAVKSVGPNSVVGKQTRKGSNENHARELLELHTVGVEAGYSQADVIALSRVLTGWGFGTPGAENYGQFQFREDMHEPGAQTIMGIDYPQAGADQGEAVLRDLARHPATARRIAYKLARHFIDDKPPATVVDVVAAAFVASDGNLKECARALIGCDEAWGASTKIKRPQEFLWSALRALQIRIDVKTAAQAMTALGQPFWNPTSPHGFPEDTASWLAPDSVSDRLDFAEVLAARADVDVDPPALVDAILGPGASAATREVVTHASSRTQALALLLMSPEFQRR